jgi:hypothetical protein
MCEMTGFAAWNTFIRYVFALETGISKRIYKNGNASLIDGRYITIAKKENDKNL